MPSIRLALAGLLSLSALCAPVLRPAAASTLPAGALSRVPSVSSGIGGSLSTGTKTRIRTAYLHSPLAFEPNVGQFAPGVIAAVHAAGGTAFLTRTTILLSVGQTPRAHVRPRLQGTRRMPPTPSSQHVQTVRLAFEGTNPTSRISYEGRLPGVVNYYIGNDPKRWHTGVPTYRQIVIQNLYTGIDLRYHGNQGHLEYDLIVHPGANLARLQLEVGDAHRTRSGDLSLSHGVLLRHPVAYQIVAGRQRAVPVQAVVRGQGVVYHRSSQGQQGTLVIDPVIQWSTYVGGSYGAWGYALAIDGSGNVYLGGGTYSPDLPDATNSYRSSYADGFVARITQSMSPLTDVTIAVNGIKDDKERTLDLGGNTTSTPTIDGNPVTLNVTISNTSAASSVRGPINVTVNGVSLAGTVADCGSGGGDPLGSVWYRIDAGKPLTKCITVSSDGMAWPHPADRTYATPTLTVTFSDIDTDGLAKGTAGLRVEPRPVVLVHGLAETFRDWADWTGSQDGQGHNGSTWLCNEGFPKDAAVDSSGSGWSPAWCGYPVDVMNTGYRCLTKNSLKDCQVPQFPTYKLAEDAWNLGEYVERVKAATGADRVDLVAHSMGGLISRYYIAHDMRGRTVTRLIMIGTPNQGAAIADAGRALCLFNPLDCLALIFKLGKDFQPATSYNSISYVKSTFNPGTQDRQGAFFTTIGGNLFPSLACPEDYYPNKASDLVVSLDSLENIADDPATGRQGESHFSLTVMHVPGLNCKGPYAEQQSSDVFNQTLTQLKDANQASSLGQRSAGTAARDTSSATVTSPIMAASSDALSPGQSATLHTQVASGTTDLHALVTAALGPNDTRPTVTLTDPDGNTSTAGSTRPGVTYLDLTQASPYPPMLGFDVQNPTAGAWMLTITNPSSSTLNPMVIVPVFGTDDQDGLSLSAQTGQPAYLPGAQVDLTAALQQIANGSASPLPASGGGSVTGQIVATDAGNQFSPQPITLLDDGQHGDGGANDGVYGASFAAPSQPGAYSVMLTGAGTGQQRLTSIAFDVTDPVQVSAGWNLVDLPLDDPWQDSASHLVTELDAQLGASAVAELATYSGGRFHVYLPGYSQDEPLLPGSAIAVESTQAGTWNADGGAYSSGQPITVQPGWNLVASPYPYTGLHSGEIASQAAACHPQEIVAYEGGKSVVWTASTPKDFTVPSTAGFWLQCTSGATWTPTTPAAGGVTASQRLGVQGN